MRKTFHLIDDTQENEIEFKNKNDDSSEILVYSLYLYSSLFYDLLASLCCWNTKSENFPCPGNNEILSIIDRMKVSLLNDNFLHLSNSFIFNNCHLTIPNFWFEFIYMQFCVILYYTKNDIFNFCSLLTFSLWTLSIKLQEKYLKIVNDDIKSNGNILSQIIF